MIPYALPLAMIAVGCLAALGGAFSVGPLWGLLALVLLAVAWLVG